MDENIETNQSGEDTAPMQWPKQQAEGSLEAATHFLEDVVRDRLSQIIKEDFLAPNWSTYTTQGQEPEEEA